VRGQAEAFGETKPFLVITLLQIWIDIGELFCLFVFLQQYCCAFSALTLLIWHHQDQKWCRNL